VAVFAHPFRAAALIACATVAPLAVGSVAAPAKDGGGEVRVAGVCGRGPASELRLKARDGEIELRFRLRNAKRGTAWRIVLVQERRIAWRGSARASGSAGAFEVRRTLVDLPGDDSVTVRALGPNGLVCQATATLPEALPES